MCVQDTRGGDDAPSGHLRTTTHAPISFLLWPPFLVDVGLLGSVNLIDFSADYVGFLVRN